MPENANNGTDARNSKAMSGWNIAFGIWLVIAPFVLGYAGLAAALREDVAMGLVVIIFAIIGASIAAERWSRIVNLFAGIWILIAPFALHYVAATSALANDIILGALVIIFAASSLSSAARYRHAASHRHAFQ